MIQLYFADLSELFHNLETSRQALIQDACLLFLNESERQRYQNTSSVKSRHEFLIGRSLLRQILAEVLSIQPSEVPIENSKEGKPFVVADSNIHFSVSHSADIWALALSNNSCEVGLDLELIKERNFAELSSKAFAPGVGQFWKSNPTKENFYRLWTLKESYAKLLGVSVFSEQAREFEYKLDLPKAKIWHNAQNIKLASFFKLNSKSNRFAGAVASQVASQVVGQHIAARDSIDECLQIESILPLHTKKIAKIDYDYLG